MQLLLHLLLLTNSWCSNSRHASRLVLQRPLFLVQNSKIGGCSAASAGEGRDNTALVPLDNSCGKRDESWLLLTRRKFCQRLLRGAGFRGMACSRLCLVLEVIRRTFVKSRVCALAVHRQRVACHAPLHQSTPSLLLAPAPSYNK
jgi:hypothetical protein